MTTIVSIGGIHLVNSTGTPVAGGVATAAATTPFAIRRGWRPMPAEPIVVQGSDLLYPDIHYGSVQETIPIAVVGSTHENAVARLQELKRVLLRANNYPANLVIQPTGSSTPMYAEIAGGIVREIAEDGSGFEGWEGFVEIHAEIACTRSAFFGNPGGTPISIISTGFATLTNTGTGANPNITAYSSSLDGDLVNEGQPTWLAFNPTAAGSFTIFYFAAIDSRTYSTTGSGAKTTSSTTGTASALNAPSFAAALQKRGLKARVLFRFTNNTANVQVRVEVRANTSGTVLYAGSWITPTAAAATLYDMGRIPIELFRVAPHEFLGQIQLYIGYRSTDGSSATATLGYNEFLLYYDFCRVDTPTAVTTASYLDAYGFLNDSTPGARPVLPLETPTALVQNGNILDIASIRGRLPRAIEGGSLYLAWMAANNVHDTTKTATLTMYHAPLWRTLRGSD